MKTIKWYHYLWLWTIKEQFTASRYEGDKFIVVIYKVAFGRIYVTSEEIY